MVHIARKEGIMQGETEYATVVIPLSERDLIYIGNLDHFWREITVRLPGLAVIIVNEAGIPLTPSISPDDIPADAIWLTDFKF